MAHPRASALIAPPPHPGRYLFAGLTLAELNEPQVMRLCPALAPPGHRGLAAVQPTALAVDCGTFISPGGETGSVAAASVFVEQAAAGLLVACACSAPKAALCEHQALALLALLHRPELRVFFDTRRRHELLRTTARDYGLEQAPDLDAHFELTYTAHPPEVRVVPRQAGLLPVTATARQEQVLELLPAAPGPPEPAGGQQLIVLSRHKYYGHLTIQLAQATLTAGGKVKNPVRGLNPLDELGRLNEAAELRFYTGLARFQHQYDEGRTAGALDALRAILLNPAGLPAFAHDARVSDKLTAPALTPLELRHVPTDLRLHVGRTGDFFEISGQLLLDGQPLDLQALSVRFDYFIVVREALYLIDKLDFWRVIDFLKKRNNNLLIHHRQFAGFQKDVLANLEDKLRVSYAHVPPATPQQQAEAGFSPAPTMRLYLTDAGPQVELLPVMRYGEHEVSILSRRQLLGLDALGRSFVLARDEAAETRFTAALLRHYPEFAEQLAHRTLHVPKRLLLQEDWFLAAFDDWQSLGVEILGFNQLRDNTFNPNRAKITVRVHAENDWFDTQVSVRFGRQAATLAQVQRAIRSRSRYVRLDDGTRGILPQEWVEKFARYFAAGELVADRIRTPGAGFAAIQELYRPEEIDAAALARLSYYQQAVADLASLPLVEPPAGLQATLRGYQRQGLSWLAFLDSHNFGGCLADDMGLGKTLQVLALLLRQREQGHSAPSLVVVPTSLVFNWQAEARKFTPGLRVLTLHGAARRLKAADFAACDLVLTTYGTLVADLKALRAYRFNYVVLDESQAIKNPDSQRYKAACLLQSRNRLVLTGTPVENNTYDLYGQLSFACPGLLGSRQHFQDQYAGPIDKFKDPWKARALQQKIAPFVLRRTRAQVARELPEKTEMVLYCEMGDAQRRVYEACKKEFRDRLMGQHEDTQRKSSLHVLRGLTRLRQVCDSPALLRDGADYGEESAKLDALLDELERRAPQHKILVFSQFVAMLDLVRARLQARAIPFAYLTGQTRDRAGAVARFQKDESVRVFLISLKAGGTGLNLPAADYVYLVDPWWNPAVENQAIARSHRMGQTRQVMAVRLICPDTIEEKIMTLQAGKRTLAEQLIQTDAALLSTLSREELLDLLV